MALCWEDYLAKVHNALSTDSWASSVQLLDIFISKEPPSSSGWWPWSRSAGSKSDALPRRKQLRRAGSMLNLGDMREPSAEWMNMAAELKRLNAEGPPGADTAPASSSSSSSSSSSIATKATAHSDSPFRLESMPNIQASVKRSGALESVLKVGLDGGSGASGKINMKGSRAVKCTISGVKSQRVLVDEMMDLVTPPSPSRPPLWRPNPFRGELGWSFRRGQILWVVTEILYASKISMQSDNVKEVDAEAKTPPIDTNAGTIDADASESTKLESTELWLINASKEKLFPFAFRVKQLKYNVHGNLKSSQVVFKKSSSLKAIAKPAHVWTSSDRINHYPSLSFSSG